MVMCLGFYSEVGGGSSAECLSYLCYIDVILSSR